MNHVENRSVFTLTIEFPTDFNGEYMHEVLSKATQIISEGVLQGHLTFDSKSYNRGVTKVQWTTRAIDTESSDPNPSDPNPSDPNPSDPLSEEVQALKVALTSLSTILN